MNEDIPTTKQNNIRKHSDDGRSEDGKAGSIRAWTNTESHCDAENGHEDQAINGRT